MEEDLTIVGGLVPGLLIDQDDLPEGAEPHAGTMDLDLGLKIAIFEEERYKEISKRLREAGFEMDDNERGNETRQRWRITGEKGQALVEFLIPPVDEGDKPGTLKNIERDFAAFITPGLDLAFRDRVRLTLDGFTIVGEACKREIQVCGPGAFVVLKALALRVRGRPKDAYDLYYVVRNYGSGVQDVADRLIPLMDSPEAQLALEILREEFGTSDSMGPKRVARFVEAEDDPNLREDAVGFVSNLCRICTG
jgi:hypothetical protein